MHYHLAALRNILLCITLACQMCFAVTICLADQSTELTEFYRLARDELKRNNNIDDAVDYLEELSEKKRLEVAGIIARDPDLRINGIGLNILVLSGHEEEALPGLVYRIASGDNLERFGYSWVHVSDDSELTLRMYIKLGRYILAHWPQYTGPEERRNLESFLSDGGLGSGNKLQNFSPAAAKKRLDELEKLLKNPL